MTHTRSILAALLFFCLTSAANAQWKSENGPPGKSSYGLAIIDTNIFAGNNNGVFLLIRSDTDTVWTQAGLTGIGIQSLGVSGSNLIAETVAGLAVSGDLGANWNFDTSGMGGQYVFATVTSGGNLIAGTDNGIYISNNSTAGWVITNDSVDEVFALAVSGSNTIAGSEGILLSADNGATWNETDNALSGTDVLAFAENGNDLLAGTDGLGVFISHDNGASWSSANNGLTDSTVNVIAVIGSKLFAGTEDSGVFLSLDNGENWLAVNRGFPFSPKLLCVRNRWHRSLCRNEQRSLAASPCRNECCRRRCTIANAHSIASRVSESVHTFCNH